MAIHFGSGITNQFNQWVPGNGNGSACVGGQWNPQNVPPPYAWGNPLSGATALSVAIAVKPDSAGSFYTVGMPAGWTVPYSGTYSGDYFYGAICGQNGAYPGTASFFAALASGSQDNVMFRVINFGNYDALTAITTNRPLRYGQWNYFVFRWRASDQLITIWSQGVACPVTTVIGPTGIVPTQLTVSSAGGPIEIGAFSSNDTIPLQGAYARFGLWTSYLPDVDAVAYGGGALPSALSQNGLIRYVELNSDLPHWQSDPVSSFAAFNCGSVVDLVTGHTYGAGESGDRTVIPHKTFNDEGTLAPFGGLPGGQPVDAGAAGYTVVPGPVAASVTNIIEDQPSLPVEWFELEELNGNCGKRSGLVHLVPSQKTFSQAVIDAQYGDDIVIDHTYTGTVVSQRFLPEKSVGANTPRMPPHQKRLVTMSRGVTSAR